jgi:hypothetical protein
MDRYEEPTPQAAQLAKLIPSEALRTAASKQLYELAQRTERSFNLPPRCKPTWLSWQYGGETLWTLPCFARQPIE